jgi:hypothetical protein
MLAVGRAVFYWPFDGVLTISGNAWVASVGVLDLHVGKAYAEGPLGGLSDPVRTVMLGIARLGSGFFGLAAT